VNEIGGPPDVIVVGVDGSEASKAALRWAAGQARQTRAAIHAVTAWDYGWGALSAPQDVAAAEGRTLARTVRDVVGDDPTVEVRETVTVGDPARVLVDLARTAVLLVVGSRSHGPARDSHLGAVSTYCLQHAACPVVVVRP